MIRITGLKKEFPVAGGVVSALPGLDLEIGDGEFFVLLGPSGSGKSTLLRCIAGIETPDAGEIWLGDHLIYSNEKNVLVRPEDRGLGMVFQSYAVWPHMTVYKNVALPLTHGVKKIPKSEVSERVMHALSLVQMEDFASRPVPFLSGGQQQRVALARALAVEPLVLLMDEPLSNLDARLREEVRQEIRRVTQSIDVTVIYVTHDQTEALALGDRIAVMEHGRILQVGSPDSLFQRPAEPMVADFFGQMNWLDGIAKGDDSIETSLGTFQVADNAPSGPVRLGIRPFDIQIMESGRGGPNELTGNVVDELFLGEQVQLSVQFDSDILMEVKAPKRVRDAEKQREIVCRIDSADILVFPRTD
jgi:iron(III) transport system ATP-binding protein